jgi:hypothetical protein
MSDNKASAPDYLDLVSPVAEAAGDKLRRRADELQRLKEKDDATQKEIAERLQSQSKNRAILPVKDWITNQYYVGAFAGQPGKGGLFDPIKEALVEIFEGNAANNYKPYFEVVITGGIGWGKSSLARAIALRSLYELLCMGVPQHYLGNMLQDDQIMFMNFNLDETRARKTLFQSFRKSLSTIDFFKEEFPPRKGPTRWLDFPKNISWYPGGSNPDEAISENLHLCILDECNRYAYVERSKRSRDGKPYDAAELLHRACYDRITNRYYDEVTGTYPRTAKCVSVSQARYPEDFLERREEYAKEKAISPIYVMRSCEWEVRPVEQYEVQGWFWAASPPPGARPEIYYAEDWLSEKAQRWRKKREKSGFDTFKVPRKYLEAFMQDIDEGMRTLAGRPSVSILPFLSDPMLIQRMVTGRRHEAASLQMDESMNMLPMEHPQKKVFTTLQDDAKILVDNLVTHSAELDRRAPICCPEADRFMHVDGSLGKKDAVGICIGHVHSVQAVSRIAKESYHTRGGPLMNREKAPIIWIDLILQVKAPRGGEIDLGQLREFIYLFDTIGFRFDYISFDGWSGLAETKQKLEEQGHQTELVSLDRESAPYKTMRRAMKEQRLLCYQYDPLIRELESLEYNESSDKIDHPPHGTKDLSDALAAVVWACETSDFASIEAKDHLPYAPRSFDKGGTELGSSNDKYSDRMQKYLEWLEAQKAGRRRRRRVEWPDEFNSRTYKRPSKPRNRKKKKG